VANDLSSNPWIIETAGVITYRPKRVTKMRWHPTAADNDLVVCHSHGSVVWPIRSITGSANNESVGCEEINFNPPFPFEGIKVETLDAGKLYIFFDTVY
jgi:hypothetical protein